MPTVFRFLVSLALIAAVFAAIVFSLGNLVEPMELIEKFSAEAFRYYFMSQCPFGGDGEFSFERFADAYNSGLANNLGNNYSRILTMCLKYFEGDLGAVEGIDLTAWRRGLDLPALVEDLREKVGGFDYNTALQRIWLEVVDAANKYIQETAPFKLFKTDPEGTRVILANLADWMRVTAVLIKPFLPRVSETFYTAFSFGYQQPWSAVSYATASTPFTGDRLRVTAPIVEGKPAPLFPKIDSK